MRGWVVVMSSETAAMIEAVAFLVIVAATLQAAYALAMSVFEPQRALDRRRAAARYARYLVAGLTFQLAAAILELPLAAGWDAVERIAVLVALRALLAPLQETGVAAWYERVKKAFARQPAARLELSEEA